jgi:hypothetical protein
MTKVSVVENKDTIDILIENGKKFLLKSSVEPDENRKVEYGITSDKTLEITKISYPKDIYSLVDVAETAREIERKIKEIGCYTCVIMGASDNTRKTFLIPTLKDYVRGILDD